MERFNVIFSKQFATSKKAIVYCQNLARLCGFGVRIRTSKTTTIYIVCSREGLPDLNRESAKRSRNSERCNCDWRIVLFRRNPDQWEFRTGKTLQHNHVVFSSEEFLDAGLSSTQQSVSPLQQVSPPPSQLPPIHSLDLPPLRLSGTSSPLSEPSPPPSNMYRLPPLTNALPKIMQRPSPYSRPHSLAFLLN